MMMKAKVLAMVTLAGVIALLLVACGGAGPAASDPLDGTSWVLTAYGKTSPIPGTTLTATFEEGQVSGSAGCNTYRGSYEIDGSAISFGRQAITMMACSEPEGAMQQEMEFTGFLSDARTFQLADEQLQIFREDGEALTFIPGE